MTLGIYLTWGLIAQYVVLALVFALGQDIPRTCYWIGAALLNVAVLYIK